MSHWFVPEKLRHLSESLWRRKSGHTALKYIESISQDLHPKGSERRRATVAICAGMSCERLRPASGIVRGEDPAEPSIPDAGPDRAEGRTA
jgi:hypothetical protein